MKDVLQKPVISLRVELLAGVSALAVGLAFVLPAPLSDVAAGASLALGYWAALELAILVAQSREAPRRQSQGVSSVDD